MHHCTTAPRAPRARKTNLKCEDCAQKWSKWGVPGDTKKLRWCCGCGKAHVGAVT